MRVPYQVTQTAAGYEVTNGPHVFIFERTGVVRYMNTRDATAHKLAKRALMAHIQKTGI